MMRWFRRRSMPLLSRLARERAGAVAVIVALMLVPLVGAVGLAVDAARAALLKSRLVAALDAAALAGGRVLVNGDPTADVRMYFKANFQTDFLGAQVGDPEISIGINNETISLRATALMPTTFTRVLGINTMTVVAENTVRRTDRGMELVLVMDNTGSMGEGNNSKMATMKSAATELINILYGNREVVSNLWVALVPYVATVNIGTQHADWLAAGSLNQSMYAPSKWKGCVQARPYPYEEEQAEALPEEHPWLPHYWHTTLYKKFFDGLGIQVPGDNDWGPGSAAARGDSDYDSGKPPKHPKPPVDESRSKGNEAYGPNLGCGPPITSLTASKTTILARISEMNSWSRGGTMANLGLAWAWRTISPAWRGRWGGDTPANMPLDYNSQFIDKVVILLTDGVNQWYDYPGHAPGCDGIIKPCLFPDGDYTAYGRLSEGRLGTTSSSTATTAINNRMSLLCNEMKKKKIFVYTITFQVNSQSTKNLYASCATSPSNYFDSPSNDDLRQIFREIAAQLSNLRLER